MYDCMYVKFTFGKIKGYIFCSKFFRFQQRITLNCKMLKNG
jgi:hypothetical protein